MNLKDIEKIVKGTLSDKRFYHSVCVMNKCAELAKKYNIDIETAKKVGLAHDIAKEMTTEEKLAYISANNIKVEDVEVRIFSGQLEWKYFNNQKWKNINID